ncbi:trichohyalin-like [Papaver somniferum]|uniref:trichohyalin-like n=1 Tax=Papaver somniferum TaxID=3469 RepID=UPI000E6F942F|nr:trichohyalin-like [Papaver somniferum]
MVRRSKRIAGRRRSEIAESSRMGERDNPQQQVNNPAQQEPVQNNTTDYDRVSVHTSQTDSTEENAHRTEEGRFIEGDDEDMKIAELRQRLADERRREEEERVNLMRLNNELREENIRLQEKKSRNQPPTDDRYVQHGEDHRMQEDNRDNRYEQRVERYQDEQRDPEQGRMILHGRQVLRDQCEREAEVERYIAEQNHAHVERERRRRIRQEIEEREFQDVVRENNHDNLVRRCEVHRTLPNQTMDNEEEQRRTRWHKSEMIRDQHDQVEQDDRERQGRMGDVEEEREMQEAIRQNRHDNRVMQARLKRPMQQDQVMNEQILGELAEMREMMTTRRDGGRRQLDEEIEEAGKTPFATQI